MKSTTRVTVLLLSLLVGLAPALLAQPTTGSLTGTVTQGGSGLPGVTVTITSAQLQGARVAVTSMEGGYNFNAVPPGDYKVTFEMDGMSTVTRSVKVTLAQASRADVEMALSAVAETLTVTASAPAVMETTEVQSNVQASLIEELPTGRTLIATVNLAPGVNANGPAGATTISGAPSFDSVYFINGSQVNEVLRGQPLDLFIEDALQETTVMTGAVSAEYGRFTGGVVSAISKSGGNDFSGSFRDSLTNLAWSEVTPLEEAEGNDDILSTYEATFGGRILRDQLWFFAAARYFERDTEAFLFNSTDKFPQGREQTRLEGKLTWQATPKHSLVGSYLDLQDKQTNNVFGSIWEPSAIDESRETPQTLASLNYNGVITNNLLLSATYAESDLTFVDAGGPTGDFAHATNVYDAANNAYFGAPTFASNLGDKIRSTENWGAKGSYYLSTKSLGTHNIVAGYEDYTESLLENNSQSGSDFTVWTFDTPERAADGTLLPIFDTANALIIYFPILVTSTGNDFNTQSLFVNDKWDLNNHWSFNLGVRYDKNVGTDQGGVKVADDDGVSPRFGVNYDVMGDGRIRLNATYSEYASKISNGNVGDAASVGGSPSYLYWLYYGDKIEGLPTTQALQQMYDWFQSVGGIDNQDFLLGGGSNGIATQIREKLSAPAVEEWTLGIGSQIGTNGFVRVDYQDRDWKNFYSTRHTLEDGTAFDPLAGANVDVGIVTNSDNFTREYKAWLVQGNYAFTNRFSLGGNYTWSELIGNSESETAGAGPTANTDPLNYYPEFLAYAQRVPVGYLNGDQRHKARLWLGYDLPTPVGSFNFSVLERFDSGTPYSVIGTIDVHQRAACPQCRPNPGYITVPTANNYYFSERGEFRWDDVTATDLAINYTLPVGPVQFFVQAEVVNLFDEDAQVFGNTTVLTASNSSCRQTAAGPNPGSRCLAFDPFTETPVEGVHYRKGSNFGNALNPTNQLVAGDYQLPRTYRGSFGIKF